MQTIVKTNETDCSEWTFNEQTKPFWSRCARCGRRSLPDKVTKLAGPELAEAVAMVVTRGDDPAGVAFESKSNAWKDPVFRRTFLDVQAGYDANDGGPQFTAPLALALGWRGSVTGFVN